MPCAEPGRDHSISLGFLRTKTRDRLMLRNQDGSAATVAVQAEGVRVRPVAQLDQVTGLQRHRGTEGSPCSREHTDTAACRIEYETQRHRSLENRA